MLLSESTLLVAGGASGLGAATARVAAAGGANVVIADVNPGLGEALAAELGGKARFVACDVISEEQARAAVARCAADFGALHVLVNCAGVGTPEKVVGRDGPHRLASFSRIIQINLIGTFNMLRLAAEMMQRNTPNAAGERGVIINTASVAAFDGQIGQAAYSASKGGVVAMTLPIARELARSGVRVMTIAPGLFDTPLLQGLPEAARISLGQQVPFPSRLGRPGEYAALARHIIENEMLNGEVIRLDGAIRMSAK
jgi:NAD(P)-dependent dehydrogenase (short-subunit alcohol dehydrogenase family)